MTATGKNSDESLRLSLILSLALAIAGMSSIMFVCQAAPALQAGSSIVLYGPQRFDYQPGPSRTIYHQFMLSSAVAGTLHIQNGAAGGSNRVAGAVIQLNGAVLSTARTLNLNTSTLDIPAGLLATNSLSVRMTGAPGSYLIITILAKPEITAFSPASGRAGDSIGILGNYFDDSGPNQNIVRFARIGGGQTTAQVTASAATQLSVVVPADAATGPVSVQTAGGVATSPGIFEVQPSGPVIADFNPKQGPAGTIVTLAGVGLKIGNDNPAVTFAGANNTRRPAGLISATPNEVKVTVPNDAVTGTIQLTNADGMTITNGQYTVTMTLSIGPTPFEVERAGTKPATLTLSALAPQGGLTINLSSDSPSTAIVPASVVIAVGQISAEFPVTGVAEGSTTIRASATGIDPLALAVTVIPPSPATIITSPANGEDGVAVTRETILRFSRALSPTAEITPQRLFAAFGGQTLPTRIHLAPDRQTVTLFYLQTLPASARVRVTFNTDGILDELGVPLDGNRDGQPGGPALIDFDTLTLTTLPGTAVVGRVFASQLGDGGVNTPLAGVVVSVDGLETTLRTTTDAMGNFRLEPAPVGEFFVHIDGRAATNGVPIGAYYPFVGKKWESKAGQTMTVPDVFLPLIVPDTLQPASQTQQTVITFPASVLAQDPRLTGVQITVPADSLYSDNGARGGMVGIAPVAPDRIPSPLPPGLAFPLVITVQTDGATNFDRPVPVCFPNLPDPATGQPLAAGAKSALWSFNHDIGDWEIVGPMTVSQDGAHVCSDPGVGIRQPGWHGTQPGTTIEYILNSFDFDPDEFNYGNPAFWPPPHNLTPEPGTGAYVTNGNQIVGADPFEAADNREAIMRCVNDSSNGICIVGSAGSTLFGASVLSFNQEEKGFDHVAIAYLDRNTDPPVPRITELLTGPLLQNPLLRDLTSLFGSSNPQQPRSLDEFAGTTDRVTAVPVHLSNSDADRFLQRALGLTAPGSTYSFIRDWNVPWVTNGNTCASSIAEAIRETGIDQVFGISNDKGWNVVTPKQVVDFWKGRNRAISQVVSVPGSIVASGTQEVSLVEDAKVHRLTLLSHRYYYRIDFSTERNTIETLRGFTLSPRLTEVVSPAAVGYLLVYDATGGLLIGTPVWTGVSGSRTQETLPLIKRRLGDDPDDDRDGLGNLAEAVIGTSLDNPDTDGDGVLDGAEVRQGTNPLDGLAVRTGIIATADTPGTAVDIAARNDIAVVADSNRGISILNVAAGLNPVIVAQVDTPGTAQAVAFEGNLVAVADGSAGLAIVDISDPPAARIVRQINSTDLSGGATAVTVAGGTAYVGLDSTKVAAVDLATGAILETVALPGVGPVHDLAIERDTLYVLSVGQLHAIPLQSPLQVSESVASPGSQGAGVRRFRLFVGGGIAYGTHASGYNTFNLTNPSLPALIAVGSTQQFGWKQIVANGSGLGLAAVSPNSTDDGPHNVSLYDLSDATQTNRFITEIETPGIAAAVAIYNGIGYVADSAAGLQVVNYRAFDTAGVPPTIVLESNFSLSGTTGQAEEGHVMRLTANVSDDVQVRNVEFFVNGLSVARDGNFPFEHRFVTPLLGTGPSFTVRACAFDTGGNQTCTADITITLVDDATSPRVRVVTPPNESRHLQNTLTSLSATFSETIDTSTLTPSTFQIFSAGPDGQVGTQDDLPVTGGGVSYNPQSATAVLLFSSPLPIANYRAVVRGTVSDLSGNYVGSDFAWTFAVRGEKRWISDVSGSWHTPSNWSDNELPQPGDFVVIDRPAADVTVTYSTGTLSISSLQSTEAMVISGGELGIQSTANLTGGLTFSGGTLSGAGVVSVSTLTWNDGSLQGSGDLTVRGVTTLTGFASITGRTLRLGPTTTSGNIRIEMFSGAEIINPVGGAWELLGDASVGVFSGGVITNAGTLRKAGGTSTADLRAVVNNSGTIELQAGTLALTRGGTSSGSFVGLAGTTLRLSGTHTLDPTSQVNTAGVVEFSLWYEPANVQVAGSFNASSVTLDHFQQNSVTFTGPVGGLVRMTLDGGTATFNTTNSVSVTELTLSGGSLGGSANVTASTLTWNDGSLQGSGDLTVIGVTTLTGFASITGRTLRLGPTTTSGNIRIEMFSGAEIINPVGGAWELLGDASVGVFSGGVITNAGTLRKAGGTSTADLRAVVNNSGTVEVLSGTLVLNGGGTTTGTINTAGGTLLAFTGPYIIDTGSAVNAQGAVEFSGSANLFPVRGSFAAPQVTVTNANPTFTGSSLSIGALTLNFGITTFNTPVPVSLGALNLQGGLTATSDLTIGTLNWSVYGGFTFDPGVTITVTGTTLFTNTNSFGATMFGGGGTLRLGPQTTFVDGARLLLGGGTTLINPVNSLMQIQGELQIDWNVGGSSDPTMLINQGNLVKQGAAAATLGRGINFQSDGNLDLQAGMMTINQGAGSGIFNTAPGTTLRFGSVSLAPTSQVNAAGAVEFFDNSTVGGSLRSPSVFINGGPVTFSGQFGPVGSLSMAGNSATFNTVAPVNLSALTVDGGVLGGTAPVTAGSFSWRGGIIQVLNLTVTGNTTLPPFAGGIARQFSGSTLTFGTSTSWLAGAGLALGPGSNLVNPAGGIWELEGDASITAGFGGGDGFVSNAGTLRMVGPASTLNVGVAGFVNTGTVGLRLGGIAPGEFDRILVSGSATLSGTLDVRTMNGFVPASGDSFNLLTYGSRTGQFATILGNGETYTPTYGPSALTLTKP